MDHIAGQVTYGKHWVFTPTAAPKAITVNHGLSRKARRQGYRITSKPYERD